MTPENFVYWLNGFFDLTDSYNLSNSQVMIIREHLGLVLEKGILDMALVNKTNSAPLELSKRDSEMKDFVVKSKPVFNNILEKQISQSKKIC